MWGGENEKNAKRDNLFCNPREPDQRARREGRRSSHTGGRHIRPAEFGGLLCQGTGFVSVVLARIQTQLIFIPYYSFRTPGTPVPAVTAFTHAHLGAETRWQSSHSQQAQFLRRHQCSSSMRGAE